VSQLSQRARDRRRDAQRAASGFTITSMRVGTVELLAGEVPADLFEMGRFPGGAPPVSAPMLVPGSPFLIRVRRNVGGFARRFFASVRLVEVEDPMPRLTPVYSRSGFLEGTAMRVSMRHLPIIMGGLATGPIRPGEEEDAEWWPTTAFLLVDIVVPCERVTPASGRRFAQARRRGRAG